MSCIANFYLDGVKYSLEDYDMNAKTTQRLLQKVINAAKGKMEQQSSLETASDLNKSLDHSDILNQLNEQNRETLSEQDDEEMLKGL